MKSFSLIAVLLLTTQAIKLKDYEVDDVLAQAGSKTNAMNQAQLSHEKQMNSFIVTSNSMPESEKENTQMWAKADIDNDVHTQVDADHQQSIDMSDKNAIFHQVVASAQAAVDEEANPKPYKMTQADVHHERMT